MGSVMTMCECPNCKGPAYEDYYYKTDECYTMCPNCGYYESWELDRKKLHDDNRMKFSEITADDWIHTIYNHVANQSVQYKKYVANSTIQEGTVEDHIKYINENKEHFKEDPNFVNIKVNWYKDGKFYQYDLETDKTEELKELLYSDYDKLPDEQKIL